MKLYVTIFFFIAAVAHSQVNLSSSLTACYSLNGNAGEPVNNFTGTLSSVTATVDRFNNPTTAMYFNGTSSSYIVLPENAMLKPAHAISFSCWIKTPVVTNQYILVNKNSLASYFEAYVLCIEPSMKFMTRKGGPNGMDMVLSTTSLTADTWYHLVTTIDNSFIKLYVNGILEGSTPATFQGFDYVQGKKVFLGTSNEPSYDTPFFGTIDNARFYNRTLSAAEVSTLFNTDPTCIPAVTTGVSNAAHSGDGMKIYPNPTMGVLHIDEDINSDLRLFDMNGRLLFSYKTTDSHKTQFDLSNQPQGIYFLEIANEQHSRRIKVIKE